MTTALFLLRCVQLGLSMQDLELLTIGMINDMYVESGNDDYICFALKRAFPQRYPAGHPFSF